MTLCAPALAQVNLQPTVSGAGELVYEYQAENLGTSPVIGFSVFLRGTATDLCSPSGWNVTAQTTDFATTVVWASSEPAFDLPPGQTLAGFCYKSFAIPGQVHFQTVADDSTTHNGLTTGAAVAPPIGIPAVGAWGALIMALFLVTAAALVICRRKPTPSD